VGESARWVGEGAATGQGRSGATCTTGGGESRASHGARLSQRAHMTEKRERGQNASQPAERIRRRMPHFFN
jgi:hypothetical protein